MKQKQLLEKKITEMFPHWWKTPIHIFGKPYDFQEVKQKKPTPKHRRVKLQNSKDVENT